jgi:hypothetical protein
MAEYSKRIISKTFKNKVSKTCYLEVCKWLAVNIISNDDIVKHCSYTIQKNYDNETGLYEYNIEVYAKISERDVKNHHCTICKDTHSSFFISEETNCNWCKVGAFDRRIAEEIKKKQKYIKDKMLGRGDF